MTEQEIKSSLSTTVFGRKVLTFDSLESTNAFARALIGEHPPEGTLVICEDQTSGKGRLGRAWISEKGKNLTFTLLLAPGIPPARNGVLSLMASLAVAEALREVAHLDVECKWPNDVLIHGKKISGILSESASAGGGTRYVILGIGINVNQTKFPAELTASATSLALETGREVDRLLLLSQVLLRLESWYGIIRSDEHRTLIDAWKRHSTMFGKEVTVDQAGLRTTGIARTLDADGALIILTGGEEKRFHAGEVTIIR